MAHGPGWQRDCPKVTLPLAQILLQQGGGPTPESKGPRRLDSEPCAHADLSSQLDEEAQLCKGRTGLRLTCPAPVPALPSPGLSQVKGCLGQGGKGGKAALSP